MVPNTHLKNTNYRTFGLEMMKFSILLEDSNKVFHFSLEHGGD